MKTSKKFKELSDKEQREILKIPEGLHEYRTTIRLLINHLLKSDMKALFLLENKGRSWLYTNEIPDDALIDFISGVFIDDPHLMNMVMKEYNDQMGIDEPKKENIGLDQDINKEDILKLAKEIKTPYKDPEEQFPPEYIQEKYNISTKTLANWRSEKRGPKYIKMGKKIRYLRKDVEKWFTENTVKTYNKPKKA